jgi:hypothetical protein
MLLISVFLGIPSNHFQRRNPHQNSAYIFTYLSYIHIQAIITVLQLLAYKLLQELCNSCAITSVTVYLAVQQRESGMFTTLMLLTLNMTALAQIHHVSSIAVLYSTVATSHRMTGVKMSLKTSYMYLILFSLWFI